MQRKKNCNRITALEQPEENYWGVDWLGWGGGGVLQPVLYARIFALNSDVAPNYKYMFNQHKDPLPPL